MVHSREWDQYNSGSPGKKKKGSYQRYKPKKKAKKCRNFLDGMWTAKNQCELKTNPYAGTLLACSSMRAKRLPSRALHPRKCPSFSKPPSAIFHGERLGIDRPRDVRRSRQARTRFTHPAHSSGRALPAPLTHPFHSSGPALPTLGRGVQEEAAATGRATKGEGIERHAFWRSPGYREQSSMDSRSSKP